MSGRMLLAFALTFIVILVTQQLMSKYYKKPEPQPVKNESVQQPASNAAAAPASAGNQPSTSNAPAGKAGSPSAPARQGSLQPDIVIENDLYKITLTNKGAQAKSWILKKYQDDKGRPLELVHPI